MAEEAYFLHLSLSHSLFLPRHLAPLSTSLLPVGPSSSFSDSHTLGVVAYQILVRYQ